MNRLYTLLLYLFFPVLAVRLVVRGLKNPEYWKRWRERFGFVTTNNAPYTVWVHAVSVGEVNASAPLIKEILLQFPDHRVLVTTMTPTGSHQLRNHFGDEVDHVYIPYDYPGAVKRFLRRMQPAVAVIMETEIWPNILLQCKAKQIPVLFANVRLSRKSAKVINECVVYSPSRCNLLPRSPCSHNLMLNVCAVSVRYLSLCM